MVGRETLTLAMQVRILTREPLIQESSNGRTAESESAYRGSNPCS